MAVAVTFDEAVVIICIRDAVELCRKKRRGSCDDDGTNNTEKETQSTSRSGMASFTDTNRQRTH